MKSRIMFIGGVPGVGKTSISGYIARIMGIDIVLSSDYLREFLRPFAPESSHLGTSVYDAWKFHGDMNDDNIIRGYLDQAKPMMEGINRVISRALANGEDLVIESLYFVPEMMDKGITEEIFMAYIYIQDPELHRSRLEDRVNYTHRNSPGTRLAAHLREYRAIMDYTMRKASESGIGLYMTDHYEQARERLLADFKVFAGQG
ncbi:mevalonate-3-phosphate 5-kinase [Thermoplasma sp.]|uniref:mevalonate-3-phosphate 5-kinase n=1 Tax=Thermoplasma sp. TaxID=1973142 RepID=UPI00127D8B5E|nr:mevalonate-3-phosphate 5-kinase [Thermoplasma sp.]KAA8922192.1 MAG: mevalonate-3-phosphate 5-kinase [Thermoplasma sp.]